MESNSVFLRALSSNRAMMSLTISLAVNALHREAARASAMSNSEYPSRSVRVTSFLHEGQGVDDVPK